MLFPKFLVCVGAIVLAALSTNVMGSAMKQSRPKFLSEGRVSDDDLSHYRLPIVPDEMKEDLMKYAKELE